MLAQIDILIQRMVSVHPTPDSTFYRWRRDALALLRAVDSIHLQGFSERCNHPERLQVGLVILRSAREDTARRHGSGRLDQLNLVPGGGSRRWKFSTTWAKGATSNWQCSPTPQWGLKAIIAIHDTTLGPACGGARIWNYQTDKEAIWDALRLGRAMTYKAAAADLPLGGGKAVIIADPHTQKTEALMRAFGRFVDTLGGRYLTTTDVGSTGRDMEYIRQETEHVVGLPTSAGGSGDTAIMTGLGVYMGMKACAREVWGVRLFGRQKGSHSGVWQGSHPEHPSPDQRGRPAGGYRRVRRCPGPGAGHGDQSRRTGTDL